MDYSRPELVDALAAQYVTGTLRGAARRRFESLLPGHPALRAATREWQQRLIPLTAVIESETPPARVWTAIEQRLWPATSSSAIASRAVSLPWWQRVGPLRALAGFASVAALSFGLILVVPPAAQPPVVIVLQGTGGDAQGQNTFVASVSADGRALVTRPLVPVAVQADRALELWSVPPQGAPRSLGLISPSGATVLPRDRLPPALLKGGTAALAVSVEPPGGSPTGAPTGPVVYVGKLSL